MKARIAVKVMLQFRCGRRPRMDRVDRAVKRLRKKRAKRWWRKANPPIVEPIWGLPGERIFFSHNIVCHAPGYNAVVNFDQEVVLGG